MELLCERGYSQLDSSGVGEAVSNVMALGWAIYYIYMLRQCAVGRSYYLLLAVAVGISNIVKE